MEYLTSHQDDNFGMAITLKVKYTLDGDMARYTECPRLGCCPKGGRMPPR